MTSYVWHQAWPAPGHLPVRQVYAWVLDENAQVLLIEMPGGWNLPGGTPEPWDEGWEATLSREVAEEASITVREVIPLGYQAVRTDDGESFAQLRVVARVQEWLPAGADPDTGLVYPRVWVPLERAAGLLGWGEPGRAQAVAAARVAHDVYGFAAAAPLAQGARCASTPVMQRV
ncbi:NUDIX hydrolase [Streptomyces sp. PTM05]|uniref:NUDIX hydrolase n=1 Tax=Streptantibioticus parmotrematis TaxID=2873249 RepID=A0ABS7R183_9ACTN|nr:NUDIX hydrolase [Streptantibioticus parmotrematis]